MCRRLLMRLLLGATMLIAMMSFSPQRSEAGWWHRGYYGYYRPYVRVVRPYYYWGGWYSPWWRGRYYSRVSYSPCCYSSFATTCYNPCCTSCWDPCGVTVSDCCASTTISSQLEVETGTPTPAGTMPGPEAPPPIEDAPLFDSTSGAGARVTDKALLSVAVPEEAKVFVNGQPTKTPGAQRRYVSPGLARGFSYTYEVRAEVLRDGQTVSETKRVHLRAGQTADLAFQFPVEATVETVLTLHLPENATVTLDGRATKATGPVRKFATTKLDRGQQWAGYQVAISVQHDGRTLTRNENVTLVGGENRELTFDFVDQRLALR